MGTALCTEIFDPFICILFEIKNKTRKQVAELMFLIIAFSVITKFKMVCEDLIFANIREFVASRIQIKVLDNIENSFISIAILGNQILAREFKNS